MYGPIVLAGLSNTATFVPDAASPSDPTAFITRGPAPDVLNFTARGRDLVGKAVDMTMIPLFEVMEEKCVAQPVVCCALSLHYACATKCSRSRSSSLHLGDVRSAVDKRTWLLERRRCESACMKDTHWRYASLTNLQLSKRTDTACTFAPQRPATCRTLRVAPRCRRKTRPTGSLTTRAWLALAFPEHQGTFAPMDQIPCQR